VPVTSSRRTAQRQAGEHERTPSTSAALQPVADAAAQKLKSSFTQAGR